MQAFRREQKIYRSIGGRYNVKLYYSFQEDGLYFFILDFGCGGTLRELLQQEVYLEERFAKVYLANLVLAVESLHAMDIIHSDLKPVPVP
jgi:serine/threonine protein kinase